MKPNPATDPIAGLGFDGTAEILYSYYLNDNILIHKGSIDRWTDWPPEVKDLLQTELDNDIVALATVKHIEESNAQLFEFTKCRYGALNNVPDIVDGKLQDDQEYWDCGKRGECPYEGKRCNQIKGVNGILRTSELRVIKEIAGDGGTNEEIGERLFISGHTVKTHIDNIRFKLAVKSKSDITAFAYKKGLITN